MRSWRCWRWTGAVTAGRTEGFIKLIARPRSLTGNLAGGQLLGATIVAARAGEMINELALARPPKEQKIMQC